MSNTKLRMQLRKQLLSLLNKELDLAKTATDDSNKAYTKVAYEMLYVFDSLVTGSTIEYTSEKHHAFLGLADYIYRYTKA